VFAISDWLSSEIMACLAAAVVGLLPGSASISRHAESPPAIITRRRVVATTAFSTLAAGIRPLAAFDNGVEEMQLYANISKNPGTQPALLGIRNGKLATCDYAPNCFSTSGGTASESRLKPWKAKAGSSAMAELLETVRSYPPGQANVDKGGFSIITASADYLYVQFESLKHGFIDDVEFAVNERSGEVQVRSASRLGFLDLRVNAKRLNWISADLRAKGWTAPAISKADYPDYFDMLPFTFDDYVKSVLTPDECVSPGNLCQ
jgi:uncharacterized protein (DUF1499 family)